MTFRQSLRVSPWIQAAFVLVVFVLGVHWPTGPVDFVFDDHVFVVNNPGAQSVSAAVRAAVEPFPSNLTARGLYRPLTALSYGLDSTIWGKNARGFAVTNALLYLAVALLAWGFFSRQLPSAPAAFITALLFAVHPIHTEAVDAIAGRSELLMLLFSLVTFRAFERGLEVAGEGRTAATGSPAWLWPWLSAFAYALGCAAKETAVVLPAILAAHAAILRLEGRLRPERCRFTSRMLLPHLLVLVAYLLVRWAVLGGFTPSRSVLGNADLGTRMATMGAIFAEYLRLLVFPTTLQTDGYYLNKIGIPHTLTVQSAVGWATFTAIILAALLAVRRLARRPVAVGAYPRPGSTATGAFLRGLAIFLVFLFPVSQILPMGALMAERFLFAPSLGFLLALAATVLLLYERSAGRRFFRRVLVPALIGVVVVFGTWRSRTRAQEWRDAVRLWEVAAQATPGDIRVQTNLAAELIQRGDLDRAERVLLAALETDPGSLRPTYNLALIAARRGDLARAAALFEEVLRKEPHNMDALVALARTETRRGDRPRAAALLSRAHTLASGRADLEQQILALGRELAQ